MLSSGTTASFLLKFLLSSLRKFEDDVDDFEHHDDHCGCEYFYHHDPHEDLDEHEDPDEHDV